jgi:hypothetical protein
MSMNHRSRNNSGSKVSSVFDYFDRLPQPSEVAGYLKYSSKYDLPIHAVTWVLFFGKR